VKVAFAGAGGIVERHLAALASLTGVEVVGIAGRRPERVAALLDRFGGRPFSDPVAMLDQAQPDALFICLTPAAHDGLERAAIERGVPFLVEKPLAVDWEPAAAVAAEVARTGLVTAVGYQWRYAPSVARAFELLQDARIAMAQGFWLTRTPPPAWWSRQSESGGQMVEQTTHMFDLARMFLGEAESVHALATRVPRTGHPECDVDEASLAQVRFASGAIASFASTHILAASHKVGLHLYAENLAVEIRADGIAVDRGAGREEMETPGDATAAMDAAFLDAVARKDPGAVRSSYADALETHRLTTTARESARSGWPLPLSQPAGS
jgi:predicted dehydrogenase